MAMVPITRRDYTRTVAFSGSANSAKMSLNSGGFTLAGLIFPAGWSATTITLQMSIDGGTTWFDIMDPVAGGKYTLPATACLASSYVPVDLPEMYGVGSVATIRLVQGGTNTATITLALAGQ